MMVERPEEGRDLSKFLVKYCGITTTSEEWTGWTCEVCTASPNIASEVLQFWFQRPFPLQQASWRYRNERLEEEMRQAGAETVVDFAWCLLQRDRERLKVSGFPTMVHYHEALELVEVQLNCKPYATSNDFVQRLFMGEMVFHR
jgi:hypothetical protein